MERMIEQGGKDGKPLSYEERQRQKEDIRQVIQVSIYTIGSSTITDKYLV
jgi:hypothetical protein